MLPYAHNTLQNLGEYHTGLLTSPHKYSTLQDPLDTTLDFSKVFTLRYLLQWDKQGGSPSDCCLVTYSIIELLGLLHTRSSEGLLSFKGDLQSSVSGDGAVLDAWLGVERQTGALEGGEGGRGALNGGVVLTLGYYKRRGGRIGKGF